jgi:hypothetical protein
MWMRPARPPIPLISVASDVLTAALEKEEFAAATVPEMPATRYRNPVGFRWLLQVSSP